MEAYLYSKEKHNGCKDRHGKNKLWFFWGILEMLASPAAIFFPKPVFFKPLLMEFKAQPGFFWSGPHIGLWPLRPPTVSIALLPVLRQQGRSGRWSTTTQPQRRWPWVRGTVNFNKFFHFVIAPRKEIFNFGSSSEASAVSLFLYMGPKCLQ
jgi:hypothetical protein